MRVVSFDGVTSALEQDFTYVNNSNPSSKTTTVKTYDLRRNQSFEIVYSYGGVGAPNPPNSSGSASGIPVEKTITYYQDLGTTVAKTVTKAWLDQYRLACELTTLDNGVISGDFYQYGTSSFGPLPNLVTDKQEFDFGQITSTSYCQMPSANGLYPPPSGVTPVRE